MTEIVVSFVRFRAPFQPFSERLGVGHTLARTKGVAKKPPPP
jgi:hypothetical protein